tara:strand:+ start:1831 stop:2418 length:588 start_codon:yes stop_codon:yes gene_type:complete
MLNISKGNPWLFWPSHICDTFPENPANKVLTGFSSFDLVVDLKVNKVQGEIGTLFTLLPHYTAMDIYDGRLLFTLMNRDNETKYYDLPTPLYDGIRLKIHWQHIAKDTFTVFINNNEVLKVDLKENGFATTSDPHIIIGAGNFPKNDFNLNYVDIDLFEFILKQRDKVLCHHTFENYIFDKSVDLTGNCNFINKI